MNTPNQSPRKLNDSEYALNLNDGIPLWVFEQVFGNANAVKKIEVHLGYSDFSIYITQSPPPVSEQVDNPLIHPILITLETTKNKMEDLVKLTAEIQGSFIAAAVAPAQLKINDGKPSIVIIVSLSTQELWTLRNIIRRVAWNNFSTNTPIDEDIYLYDAITQARLTNIAKTVINPPVETVKNYSQQWTNQILGYRLKPSPTFKLPTIHDPSYNYTLGDIWEACNVHLNDVALYRILSQKQFQTYDWSMGLEKVDTVGLQFEKTTQRGPRDIAIHMVVPSGMESWAEEHFSGLLDMLGSGEVERYEYPKDRSTLFVLPEDGSVEFTIRFSLPENELGKLRLLLFRLSEGFYKQGFDINGDFKLTWYSEIDRKTVRLRKNDLPKPKKKERREHYRDIFSREAGRILPDTQRIIQNVIDTARNKTFPDRK